MIKINSKNYQKVNIWEFGDRINIKLKPDFINLINLNIQKQFGTKRNIHKKLITNHKISFKTFNTRMKKCYPYHINLDIILDICKLLNIDIYEMQKNIISYKTRKGRNIIIIR